MRVVVTMMHILVGRSPARPREQELSRHLAHQTFQPSERPATGSAAPSMQRRPSQPSQPDSLTPVLMPPRWETALGGRHSTAHSDRYRRCPQAGCTFAPRYCISRNGDASATQREPTFGAAESRVVTVCRVRFGPRLIPEPVHAVLEAGIVLEHGTRKLWQLQC
jgi:hypothetical protein